MCRIGSPDSTGGVITCQVPALDPGAEVTGTVGVIIDPGVPVETQLTVDATIAADDSDPAVPNDTDSTTLIVGTAIFSDGFESGGTSMWSATVP